ncbi:MAG: outer membrane beta-barrel protein [Verrucomicrobiae bacterium]|nr:outer membrane beta-barrel protein [Verrucomicrobiae bacterium]
MNGTKLIALLIIALSTLAAQSATPQTWEVKVRAAHLDTANKSDAFSALGINFPSNAIHVESKWIPELDLAYAFTENLLAEVVLTIPQKHDVTLAGVGKLGYIEHLPPTFSLIYEFDTQSAFTPYVSGGLNATWITKDRLTVAGIDLDLEEWSFGIALGAGFSYRLSDQWNLDVSAKWIDLGSDVSGPPEIGKLTNAQLDPLLISLGCAYRF